MQGKCGADGAGSGSGVVQGHAGGVCRAGETRAGTGCGNRVWGVLVSFGGRLGMGAEHAVVATAASGVERRFTHAAENGRSPSRSRHSEVQHRTGAVGSLWPEPGMHEQ